MNAIDIFGVITVTFAAFWLGFDIGRLVGEKSKKESEDTE